jgi:uncharacterized protein GlcG (DUF336 family)
MKRCHTLAAVAALSAFTGQAIAAEALPTVSYKVLPAMLAMEAAETAVTTCKGQGFNVSVTIVDRTGTTQVFVAGDGAANLTRDLSRRKAYTSATQRQSTIDFAKRVSAPGAFNPSVFDNQLVTAGGGVPIKAGDEVLGAIAVSGAPGGDKDEVCANAGIAKIADHLK